MRRPSKASPPRRRAPLSSVRTLSANSTCHPAIREDIRCHLDDSPPYQAQVAMNCSWRGATQPCRTNCIPVLLHGDGGVRATAPRLAARPSLLAATSGLASPRGRCRRRADRYTNVVEVQPHDIEDCHAGYRGARARPELQTDAGNAVRSCMYRLLREAGGCIAVHGPTGTGAWRIGRATITGWSGFRVEAVVSEQCQQSTPLTTAPWPPGADTRMKSGTTPLLTLPCYRNRTRLAECPVGHRRVAQTRAQDSRNQRPGQGHTQL